MATWASWRLAARVPGARARCRAVGGAKGSAGLLRGGLGFGHRLVRVLGLLRLVLRGAALVAVLLAVFFPWRVLVLGLSLDFLALARLGTAPPAAPLARPAVFSACRLASLAALVAPAVAVLAALVACFVAPAVASLAAWVACCVAALVAPAAPAVALRPASADFFSTTATRLAISSIDAESILESWAWTSRRTTSSRFSLVFLLRSTMASTRSWAWLRGISPAFTSSRTISSALPRVSCPRTDPASRYFRIRSLLAIEPEYRKC